MASSKCVRANSLGEFDQLQTKTELGGFAGGLGVSIFGKLVSE